MSLEKASPLNRQSSTASCDPHIRRRVYGVWEAVYYLEDDGLLGAKSLKESCSYIVLGAYAYLRLLNEIFRLSPVMLIMYALSKYWGNMQEAILLYLSSEFLHALEDGVRHGGISRESVGRAVAFRLCGLICLTWFKWHVRSLRPKVSQLLDSHYDIKIMKARMRANSLSPSEDSTQELSRHTPYYAFEALLLFACNLSTFTTHLFLLYRATRSGGTLVFSLLAILQPLQRLLAEKNIFEYQLFIYLKDACYRRLRALREMSRGRKQDYLAGDFSSYILEEYKKAYQNLRGTCIDDFHHQVTTSSTPTSQIGSAIVGDLPMIYCAWIALTSPSTLSITSVAIMQQSATSIRLSVQTVMSAIDGLRENTKAVKDFYAALDVKEYLREGEVPYPPKDDVESTRGMAINLRDVKYDYPGTHSTSSALKGISLDIQPGHLIVIVGANGSGKSTLIKLLTRLHDPTSGEISIDGIPASDYKVSDLRRATATFTQDHELFPLSLYENIGLGDCTRIRDEDAVMKAAEMGGAMDLISKLEEGADTILEPMMSVQSYLTAPIDDNHPIIKAMDGLERETDISGGEKQRVVAARTFMHINSGNVKLVAVDEPSSALDPEAELSLFQHLIEAREGKTMIFVTHRFGHLTKFADMIVCMKEGEIAEQGSHKELIELDGEYAKLYNIQASAFTDTTQ